MNSTVVSIIGLSLTMAGVGMELVRPFLFRKQIPIPPWLDTVFTFGGLLLIGGGVYLLWTAISPRVIVRSPVVLAHTSQASVPYTWPTLVFFIAIVHAAMWAVVRLPPRLILQQSHAHFNLGFLVNQLQMNGRDVDMLRSLQETARQLGLSYVQAKLALIDNAQDINRFNYEQHGIMSTQNGDKVFEREFKNIHQVIEKELKQHSTSH